MLILGYHRVTPAAKGGLCVTPAMLEDQLTYLLRRGWGNVLLEEVISSGDLAANAKTFAITLDDGYQDNYFHALPVLKRLGLRATVFVSTEYVDTGRPFPWVLRSIPENALQQEDFPLTWAQIKEMVQSGLFTFQSHTLTHPFLSTLDPERAYVEIYDSKRILEEKLGHQVSLFCYPSGDFNQEIIQLVARAGYAAAVVAPNRFIQETPFTLHRIGVYSDTTRLAFKLKTNPLVVRLQKSRFSWRLWSQLINTYHRAKGRHAKRPLQASD